MKALVQRYQLYLRQRCYNTLNLFIEKKLVYVIVIEENETRYDLLTSHSRTF